MRGEEALRRAEELLDEADADLQGWQRSEPGSTQEATLAEGVRLRVMLAHELGLMQYAPVDLEPVAGVRVDDEDVFGGEPTPVPLRPLLALPSDQMCDSRRYGSFRCSLILGHDGEHHAVTRTWS